MKHVLLRLLAMVLALTLLASSALAYTKLQKGMSGQYVLCMQLALKYLGYSIDTDGKFGPSTANVVRAFQRDHGLTADGVAGEKTLTLLYSLAPAYDPERQTPPSAAPTAAPVWNPTAAPSGGGNALVVTGGGSLNLRNGAATNAQVIASIPDGSRVTLVQQGSAWSSVIYNGQAGYVMTKYLAVTGFAPATAVPATQAPVPPSYTPSGSVIQALVVTGGGTLNLRETPLTSARVIAEIPYGAWVTVTLRGDPWSAVYYNGMNGYVMSQYLSFGAAIPTQAPALPTAAPVTAPPVSGKTALVATGGGTLNFRESPSGTARVLATIPNGTALTILSRGATWCSAVYNGQTGYVMTSFLLFLSAPPTAAPTVLPTQPPASYGNAAYVTTGGGSLNLRAEARTSAKVLTTIPNGAQLVITQRGSGWCAVSYNGYSGFVMTSFLTFVNAYVTPSPTAPVYVPPTNPPLVIPTYAPVVITPVPTSTPQSGTATGRALVTTSGSSLNLRAEASTSSRVLASMPNASSLTVISRGTEWSCVVYNGITGFAMSKYLTFLTSPATTAPTAAPGPGADPEDADPSVFTRALKKGMSGEDVAWVQNRLQELGYSARVNSVYDDATFDAVKAFQKQNALNVDGIAGSQTFAVLKSENARKASDAALNYSSLSVNSSGSEVRALQTDLKKLGYNVTVNGEYDVNTHNAVVAFQQRNGLVISGIADALTRTVLHGGSGKPYSTPVQELPADAGRIDGPAVSDIKLLHWYNEVKPSVRAGQTYTIFDPNTGLSWKLVFYSLGHHADSQPASWRDTQIMNRSFGSTSWTIHPVYVQLPDGRWTMATMHNRPHLYGSILDNGFGGHLCVHFLRDMAEAQKNDPDYGVNNQVTLRNAWKTLTGETVD